LRRSLRRSERGREGGIIGEE